jgi:hypothetical protein
MMVKTTGQISITSERFYQKIKDKLKMLNQRELEEEIKKLETKVKKKDLE